MLRALDACYYWLIGARKLIVETDAKYIKGMLDNPGIGPNATINRWIDQISMFHFELRHVAGKTFGPDGLSRREWQPGDEEYYNPEKDLDEGHGLLLLRLLRNPPPCPFTSSAFNFLGPALSVFLPRSSIAQLCTHPHRFEQGRGEVVAGVPL